MQTMLRPAVAGWLLFVLAQPAIVAAQEAAPDARAIAAALADERSQIAELKVELERRTAALEELSRRLDRLAPGLPLEPPSPSPTAPIVAPVPAGSGVAALPPRFDFYGDSKVRYETLRQDFPGCVGCPDRKRGRLRLRFGAAGRLSPDFTAVVGLGIGEVNDPNTVYTNLGSKFSRKVATWDRGYVEYHPRKAPWMNLTAGKFPYTWMRSSMTFDVDFYPEGLSERFAFDTPNAGAIKNVGLQGFQLIASEQPGDLHTTLVGEQFTARIRPADRLSTMVAVTGVNVGRPDPLLRGLLNGSDVGVRNTNATIIRDGLPSYASQFRWVNAIVENAIRTGWERLPVVVGVEYQRNLRAASSLNTAASLRLDAGRALQTGDWDFSWHLFRVEQDAILAALGESDWRAPSNVLQQRFGVDRMMDPHVQLSFTLYRGRTLDSTLPGAVLAPGLPPARNDPWTNRMYFDVTYRY